MGIFDIFKPKAPPPPEPQKPLLLFAEMDLVKTRGCLGELHRRSVVFDYFRQTNISFEEAIELYYNSPDRFFKWSVSIEPITLQRVKKTYQVFGDGVLLGEVSQSRYSDYSVRLLDALLYINKVDHLRCEIKDTEYFYLTEEEYRELVVADPYNRGFPAWSANINPKIKLLVYFEDGVVDLSQYGTEPSFPDPKDFEEE